MPGSGPFRLIVEALPTELSTDPGDRSLRPRRLARLKGAVETATPRMEALGVTVATLFPRRAIVGPDVI
jgi:hypothetical protein